MRGLPPARAAGSTANASAPQLGACAEFLLCCCSKARGVGLARLGPVQPGPRAAECVVPLGNIPALWRYRGGKERENGV